MYFQQTFIIVILVLVAKLLLRQVLGGKVEIGKDVSIFYSPKNDVWHCLF